MPLEAATNSAKVEALDLFDLSLFRYFVGALGKILELVVEEQTDTEDLPVGLESVADSEVQLEQTECHEVLDIFACYKLYEY